MGEVDIASSTLQGDESTWHVDFKDVWGKLINGPLNVHLEHKTLPYIGALFPGNVVNDITVEKKAGGGGDLPDTMKIGYPIRIPVIGEMGPAPGSVEFIPDNGQPITVKIQSVDWDSAHGKVSCIVPRSLPAGSNVRIQVHIPGQTQPVMYDKQIHVEQGDVPKPVQYTVNPYSGKVKQGKSVTLTGSGLKTVNAVYLTMGNNPRIMAKITSTEDDHVTFIAPGQPGDYMINVSFQYGESRDGGTITVASGPIDTYKELDDALKTNDTTKLALARDNADETTEGQAIKGDSALFSP